MCVRLRRKFVLPTATLFCNAPIFAWVSQDNLADVGSPAVRPPPAAVWAEPAAAASQGDEQEKEKKLFHGEETQATYVLPSRSSL